jgi:hypothetical protein
MSKNANKIGGILNLFARSARDAKTTDELADLAKDAAAAIDNAVTETFVEDKGVKDGGTKAADEAFEGAGELLGAIKELTDAVKAQGRSADAKDSDDGDEDRALGKAIRELLMKGRAEDKRAKDEGEAEELAEELAEAQAAKASEDSDDPIAAMIEELTGEEADGDGDGVGDEDLAEQEEALTVNAETMDTDNSVLESASRDTAIAILKNARPAIAGIKNAAERKKVTDALLRSIKDQLGTGKSGGIAGVMNSTAGAAKKRATDSAPKSGMFDLDAQQAAYDKRNPHIKSKEVQ